MKSDQTINARKQLINHSLGDVPEFIARQGDVIEYPPTTHSSVKEAFEHGLSLGATLVVVKKR
jgi:hypothetical protein